MKAGGELHSEKRITATDLTGVYKEIAEVIGIEATILLHKNFQGQQITLPKKLFSKDYILKQVEMTSNNSDIKTVAFKYGYTERRLRQIIKENECKND